MPSRKRLSIEYVTALQILKRSLRMGVIQSDAYSGQEEQADAEPSQNGDYEVEVDLEGDNAQA